jgi:hypothetical protein
MLEMRKRAEIGKFIQFPSASRISTNKNPSLWWVQGGAALSRLLHCLAALFDKLPAIVILTIATVAVIIKEPVTTCIIVTIVIATIIAFEAVIAWLLLLIVAQTIQNSNSQKNVKESHIKSSYKLFSPIRITATHSAYDVKAQD